jgi:hypothetical protein
MILPWFVLRRSQSLPPAVARFATGTAPFLREDRSKRSVAHFASCAVFPPNPQLTLGALCRRSLCELDLVLRLRTLSSPRLCVVARLANWTRCYVAAPGRSSRLSAFARLASVVLCLQFFAWCCALASSFKAPPVPCHRRIFGQKLDLGLQLIHGNHPHAFKS